MHNFSAGEEHEMNKHCVRGNGIGERSRNGGCDKRVAHILVNKPTKEWMKGEFFQKKNMGQKHTAVGIRWWSPTQLLIYRFIAYVWQSGRDAQFSIIYGRM